MSDYEVGQSILRLHFHMQAIKSSSVYLENVSTHISAPLRTISANRIFNTFDLDWYEKLSSTVSENTDAIYTFDGRLLISAIQFKHPNTPLYIITAELDADMLRAALSQFNTYSGSGSILTGFPSGTLESSNGTPLRYENIKSAIDSGESFATIGGTEYMLICTVAKESGLSLIRYIPSGEILTPIRFFAVWFWAFTSVVMMIIFMYAYATYRMIHKPMKRLTKSFGRIEAGDFSEVIEIKRHDEFGYLYHSFNDMIRRLNNLINQNYKQRILTQKAQLKQLQSQINPHFLSNSFFIINTMARTNDEHLLPFTKYLGAYFRFVTRNSNDVITLKEEIEHARTYAEIQQMRFSKRLTLIFEELSEEYYGASVPRLTVQPLIENAFEYAVTPKSNDCRVSVLFEYHEHFLKIAVEDNGGGISDKEIEELNSKICAADNGQEVTGLVNVNRRIQLYYGEGFGLNVSRGALGGLKVEISIGTGRQS